MFVTNPPIILAALAFAAASPALAQTDPKAGGQGTSQADQAAAQGTGPLPAPSVAPDPVPICTDRPTKANVACTVPAGNVQIETDLVNWTRMTVAGTQTDTVL